MRDRSRACPGSASATDVAEHRRENTRTMREAQRRARVVQRVVRRRVQAAHRRREQSDGRAGENAPRVARVGRARTSRAGRASRAITSPNARNAAADGTTKYAICRSPRSRRLAQMRRDLGLVARSRATSPAVRAADTDMPNRLTGSSDDRRRVAERRHHAVGQERREPVVDVAADLHHAAARRTPGRSSSAPMRTFGDCQIRSEAQMARSERSVVGTCTRNCSAAPGDGRPRERRRRDRVRRLPRPAHSQRADHHDVPQHRREVRQQELAGGC